MSNINLYMEGVNEAADGLGVPVDILKTAIALLASLLLSPLYRVVTSRGGRNMLSIGIGFSFIYFIIEQWAFFILGSIVLPYAIFKKTKKPLLASAICSFFLLLIVHGYRFITIYSVWRVDCSVYVMLLVTKLTYYGKWLQENNKDTSPSLVDFLGYNLFFPGVIAGPTFSFEVYLDFINKKYDNSLAALKLGKALMPFFISIPLLALIVVSSSYFPSRWVLQNPFYLSLPFISKVLIMNFVGFFYRVKYYGGWYFAQGATNLSGLSLDAQGGYSTVSAVSLKFENELNARAKTQYWNTSMQLWLKEVVYVGIKRGLGESNAFLGTFIVSAYWHGLYLTYYVGFIYWGMFLHINKWIYKWVKAVPKLATSKVIHVLAFIVGSSMFNYIGMFMAILNWDDAMAFHAGVYHWGTWVLVVLVGATFVVRPPRSKSQQKRSD